MASEGGASLAPARLVIHSLPVLSPSLVSGAWKGSSSRLKTGTEVLKVTCAALSSSTNEPMNIQNSRVHRPSSCSGLGNRR